jgi:hypothetical protein
MKALLKSEYPFELANHKPQICWKWGLLAACAMTLLSLYPQVNLWFTRGEFSQGAVAYNYGLGDEVAYAAYINALIQGRPRRNDPYTGRADRPDALQPESLFSIQFIPAYTVALPARALGISATTVFILLTPLVAFASALALFWLLALVTNNDRLAAAGVMVVLCFGALAAAEGAIASLAATNTHFDYFPFLRRYQPAASFPLFLVLFVLAWKALTLEKMRALASAISAGAVFGLLVFSYFYLWTAAAAWLAVLGILWLVARPADRATVLALLAVIGAAATVALTAYLLMISHLPETAESVHALVLSRRPDLFSAAELIAGFVLLVLSASALRGNIDLSDRRVIFAASFALMPFIVLNQQIITGRVMQPIHYKGFITNYSVLIASVMSAGIVWRSRSGETWKLSKRALLWVTLAAFEWGSIETYLAAKRSAEANQKAHTEMAVYVRLKEQSSVSPMNNSNQVMLFTDLSMADGAPAAAPFAVLWATHMTVYSGTTSVESKERLYRHLYYTGVGVKELDDYFHRQEVYYGYAIGLFGFDRLIDGLNPNAKPISEKEAQDQLLLYKEYVASFNGERAASPRITCVVTPIGDEPNLSNLDRWYERDAGELIGKFRVYHVKLRDGIVEGSARLSDDREGSKGSALQF